MDENKDEKPKRTLQPGERKEAYEAKQAKIDRQRKENPHDLERLKNMVRDVSLFGSEQSLDTIDDISFMGEDLGNFMVDTKRPKFHKMYLLKKHIKQIPRAFGLMPKVTDFKVMKLQTMILIEMAKEWTRRNIQRERKIGEYRKSVNPEDNFNSHGFPELGWNAFIILATVMEADSFYDSVSVDLAMVGVSMHETMDLNWSNHMMKCNKCNIQMNFVTAMEDKASINWLTFVCPTCGNSASYGKDMYLRELLHMLNLYELVNHDVYRLQKHFKADHPGKLKEHEYPKLIKGCETCKQIDDERNAKITQKNEIHVKYLEAFHKLFQLNNPFTGESYAKEEKPTDAKSKIQQLKDKRRKKPKGGK